MSQKQPPDTNSAQDIEAHLNSFASRCFRDVADRDYISARMCYRAGLISQFHWAALQAFEKYYKAILLYNRIRAKNIGHDLLKAKKATMKVPFTVTLTDQSEKFLDHLNNFGMVRYLETSYYIYGPKLFELDQAVWELRRYCRVMQRQKSGKNQDTEGSLQREIRRNEEAANRAPQEFSIPGGLLEKIIEKKDHASRAPLIWQNAYYGSKRRKRVTVPTHFFAENSPLQLHPEILDRVLQYVHIPRGIEVAYREDA